MATDEMIAPAAGTEDISQEGDPGRRRGSAGVDGSRRRYLGVAPFVIYLSAFLLLPAISVVLEAFRSDRGAATLSNFSLALHGVYRAALLSSLKLSFDSALISTIVGLLVAIAIASSRNRLLRSIVTAGAGVFANTGGVPLAFTFIATLGNVGLVTKLFADVGIQLYPSFSLFSVTGLVIVYQYFLIPLMVLIMIGPIDALRREWIDAASSLGASRWMFWRYVGLPLLLPPILAAFMVLFTDAFAAYATAQALTSGAVPIITIEIGSLLSGNVVVGYTHLGDAMGALMVVVVALTAVIYTYVQRRTSRWLR